MDDSEAKPIEIRVGDSLRLDDADIARLRRSSEDHFVERKSFGDWKKDAVKTVVAFANSLATGEPGFLFIGVRNNGDVETKDHNLDSIQMTLADDLREVYPRVHYVAKAMTEDGHSYLVIIVPGSENRPHFTGQSYIRTGSKTIEASEEQFSLLIAQRNSKARLILKFKGRQVTVETIHNRATHLAQVVSTQATLVECNQFYVTLLYGGERPSFRSIPLQWVELSHNHELEQLKIVVEE